jgi:lipopolysaccharide transport system permease protein
MRAEIQSCAPWLEGDSPSLAVFMKSLSELRARSYLIGQYLKRQIALRYKSTALGVAWSLVNPLLMLVVYTLVFGVFMGARFGISKVETPYDYGLTIFCGLNLFNLCAEIITRSPRLIVSQPNLVKKVVFPLEILPIVSTLDALIHCLIAFVPLFLAVAIVHGGVPWSFLLLPCYLIPTVLIALGCGLLLSALGVFVRDIENMMAPAITILLLGSAIFYPIAIVPETLRPWFGLNPIAVLVDGARRSLVWGAAPEITPLILVTLAGAAFVFLAGAFFLKAKPAFADVM